MNTYYLVIMNRKTKEVMVILRCGINYLASDVVYNYAQWCGVEYKDLIWNITTCANYSDVLENKDVLENLK